MVLESVLNEIRCVCPVFPAALIEEAIFSPLYILASLVTD